MMSWSMIQAALRRAQVQHFSLAGPIFVRGWGVAKGNRAQCSPTFVYRFATISVIFIGCLQSVAGKSTSLEHLEQDRILTKAERYLDESPQTVTAHQCERSAGGVHDFYSEGDYWWPNPEDPNGPYIRKDGESNPNAFLEHRKSMIRLSERVATLTCAYLLTEDRKFAEKAQEHLDAWFVEPATRMHANLLHGQAIKGRHTGRSIGIIDTLHLVEVARATKLLSCAGVLSTEVEQGTKNWFSEYLHWMNSHPYGMTEKKHPNNHGVCWSLQAATFADLVGESSILDWVRQEFKSVYIAEMMDERGGFPEELSRTKPYGYSLFIIDAMSGIAQLLSDSNDNLWHYTLEDGRGMKLGVEFIAPFIADKSRWFLPPDVMHWDDWPVRHCTLVFAAEQFGNQEYLKTWNSLAADPTVFEVLRNQPIRHPLLWM